MESTAHTDFVHTGPGTLAGRYMRTFWQPVVVGANVKPGQAVPVRIMSEDFTFYRGAGGEPHLVGFRCAHRGTQLSTGWVEDDCIRCFYHGWKYNGSGKCVEQPAEDASFARKISIASWPVKEYLGLVFAYLGDGPVPEFRRFPAIEQAEVVVAEAYTRKCNYFQNLENHLDYMHQLFTHRSGFTKYGFEFPDRITAQETDYGIVTTAHVPSGTSNLITIMPNIRWPEWGVSWRVPVDDTEHLSFSLRKAELLHVSAGPRVEVHPTTEEMAELILRGELTIADAEGRPDQVTIEDLVSQLGQGVIEDRSDEALGRADAGVILTRKIWSREMKALAEGKPLKRWGIPALLSANPAVCRESEFEPSAA
ncbi:MAG: Rieske 2Fe-2S domain-containing protein [Chloroflexi bacterium]|nr:Rieske 2Fe-2S domain-containing protein [Chloroflexota bacterium]